MTKFEKRLAVRHRGTVPVQLERGQGATRDFSSSGIFFETDISLTPGQAIEMTITLEHGGPAAPTRVKCRGQIVRVEKWNDKIGVAVAIETYSFDEFLDPGNGRPEGGDRGGGETMETQEPGNMEVWGSENSASCKESAGRRTKRISLKKH